MESILVFAKLVPSSSINSDLIRSCHLHTTLISLVETGPEPNIVGPVPVFANCEFKGLELPINYYSVRCCQLKQIGTIEC